MPKSVKLTDGEVDELNLPVVGEGGFQSLLLRLQEKLDPTTNELELDDGDLEAIPRYAFDYGGGGFEQRLVKIFGRTLGSRLGREGHPTRRARGTGAERTTTDQQGGS